jgi:hypothetical protein
MALRVDQNALRFNQAAIITLLLAAFVLGAGAGQWLVLAVAAVMLAGTAVPELALFKLIYKHIAVRSGLLKPRVVPDDPAPHQFAQGMGGVVLVLAFIALAGGVATLGWTLAALVVGLAAVNLFFGFCLGCFIYFQLDRRGITVPMPGA